MTIKQKLDPKVYKIAFPLILSNLTVPLLGFVNTAVVGHLAHSYYLGAVGIGVMIFNFIYWGLGFFRMGTTSLIAQQYGRQDSTATINTIFHSLLIAGIMGLILIGLQVPIEKVAFDLIGGSQQLRLTTQQYFFVRIWGAPAVLINYVIIGTLIGIQRSSAVFIIMTIINSLAIILDLFLVFVVGMTANGVALADVIGQYCGCIAGIGLICNLFKPHLSLQLLKLDWPLIKRIFTANRDLFIRTLCLILTFSFFTVQSARLGVVILAANTVLMNFQMIMAYALDGFANAAETLVGQNVGQKNLKQLMHAITSTGYWSALIAIGFVIIYWLFGPLLIKLMTSIPNVQQTSLTYLSFAIIMPVVGVWSYWLDGIFIGIGRFASMRNTMLLAFLSYLIVWYFTQPWGNTGLWLSMLIFLSLRGISLGSILWLSNKNKLIS